MTQYSHQFPDKEFLLIDALSFDQMRMLDYYVVDVYKLPVELMMENAGFHLAKLTSVFTKSGNKILIGVGKGNNGGGGLVAARRLKAWGYNVYLDIPDEGLTDLVQIQLERAISFGVKRENISYPDIFIDAYLGFSQRFPLQDIYLKAISEKNNINCMKISLDVPTGLPENPTEESEFIDSDIVLTLGSPKKVLFSNKLKAEVYVADIGIPKEVYDLFNYKNDILFEKSSIYRIDIKKSL